MQPWLRPHSLQHNGQLPDFDALIPHTLTSTMTLGMRARTTPARKSGLALRSGRLV